MEDDDILKSIPDYVSFPVLMKATPATEGNQRIVYVEASKESRDQQGEIVLAKALRESASIFKKFGVVDLDHKSMPSVAKRYGICDPEMWIIGQPVDVTFNGDTTIVKAQLRTGDSPLAQRANIVWDGLTKVSPPDRYYASVGGAVTGRDTKIDPVTKEKVPVITGTRWNNLALSLNPVHPDLAPASTTPISVFAKSLGAFVMKAVTAEGAGANMASLSGGAALGAQSLDRGIKNYFDFREKLAAAIRAKKVPAMNMAGLIGYSQNAFGMSADEATEYLGRFYRDLNNGRGTKS